MSILIVKNEIYKHMNSFTRVLQCLRKDRVPKFEKKSKFSVSFDNKPCPTAQELRQFWYTGKN